MSLYNLSILDKPPPKMIISGSKILIIKAKHLEILLINLSIIIFDGMSFSLSLFAISFKDSFTLDEDIIENWVFKE